MPNHVTNKIKITSANAKEALEFMQSADRQFDFNKIIPMPESLNVESGSRTDAALAYALTGGLKSELTPEQIEKYFEDGWISSKAEDAQQSVDSAKRILENTQSTPEDLMSLGTQIIANLDKYRCKTWYEWSQQNWGTKWNAYDIVEAENSIQFDTAWNSPEPVLAAWITKFNLTCTVKAFDEGHNFWFIKRYENGLLIDTRDSLKEDCDSLCKELKGYDPSAPDEDE